jgi:tetratricopeptide (TPR) repeat protein
LVATAFGQGADRLNEGVATAVARAALLDLRLSRVPTADDFVLAGAVLDRALQATPDDADLLRRRVEMAWNAGDQATYLEATERLVRADPTDSVSVMRLVAARVARLQTMEDRLAAYERLLGPGGAALDPAVRSRLAVDAALLLRERGDDAGHARRILDALELDPTNKEAAYLALRFFDERDDNPERRLDLLRTLLMADPVDPQILLELGRFLLGAGAGEQGLRFFELGDRFLKIGGVAGEATEAELMFAEWRARGPARIVERLNDIVRAQRYREKIELEMRERYSVPGPRPEPQFLTPAAEQIRMSAAAQMGDTETFRSSFADLSAAVEQRFRQIMEPAGLPPHVKISDLVAALRPLILELQVFRLWLGVDTDKVDADLQKYRELLPPRMSVPYRMYEGWRLLREGDALGALAIFSTEQAVGPWEIGHVEALLALGRVEEAARRMERMARTDPTSLGGVWAAWKREQLGLVTEKERELAARLTDLARSIPSWLDDMIRNPRQAVTLTATPVNDSPTVLEPARLRIRLRNSSPMPLSLGSDRSISTRYLLAPRYTTAGIGLPYDPEPEVVELLGRLRLMPGDTAEAVVWADAGLSGWASWLACAQAQTIRWRVMQGFVATSFAFEPGPWCVDVETRTVQRPRLGVAAMPIDDLVEHVTRVRGEALGEALVAALAAVGSPANTTPRDAVERLASRLSVLYPAWDADERALALAILPNAAMSPAMSAFDAVAADERDPGLVPLAIITRMGDPEHRRLKELADGGDPRLARLAGIQSERLRGGRMTLASRGPAGERTPASRR